MAWSVYKHTNKTNGKVYIGITRTTIEKRWRNGEGYALQTYFYNAIRKYGWDGFEHEVLFEGLTEEEARTKEIELIAFYKSNYRRYNAPILGYNATDGGEGLSGYGKQVNQYDLYGNFMKTWYSLSEAAEATNQHYTAITFCCQGRTMRAGDFMWRYWEEESGCEKIDDYYTISGIADPLQKAEQRNSQFKENRAKERIIQYSLWGEKIAEWRSIKEAADELGLTSSGICVVCQGKKPTAGNYVWRYAHPDKKPDHYPKYTRILQYKKDELVGIYLSAMDAERKTGISNSHISEVCRGGPRKHAGGFTWKKEQIEIG